MPKSSPYLEFVVEQFAPVGEITSRYMFGGWAIYSSGVIFALVADNALYLKTDDQNRADFEQRGLPAFKPFPDQDSKMNYHLAPPEIFEDAAELRSWAGKSIEAGKRSLKKKGRGKQK